MAFRKENKIKSNFSKITIGLASPEEILENSSGEVLKPETINYRTYKPERDGLFCERIFGPIKDYECHCGKYKRIRYKGIVCDRCGVEVTEKKVRRERMGHIHLVVPVAHIWYFRSLPNKIGYLLGLPTKKLDSIIYYERYVVIQPGCVDTIAELDLLSEEEYLQILDNLPKENQMLEDTDPNKFIAKIGAEAVSVHQRQEDGQGHVEKARIAGQRNQWRIDVLSKRISEEALAYLQSRYEGHSSYLRGIERHPLEPETITRKGTRIFAEGVKENGGRLFVSRQATDAELRCIMGFAERHYKDVTIHAPDTLCARMKGGITQHPEQKRTQEQSQDEGYGR